MSAPGRDRSAIRYWEKRLQAGACTKHQDLAWLYPDGSVTCMYALIIETSSADCTFGPMPTPWLEPKVVSGSCSDLAADATKRTGREG